MKPKPSELKPCPFCGKEAKSYAEKNNNQIGCDDQDCIGFYDRNIGYATMEMAKKFWNTRPKLSVEYGLDEKKMAKFIQRAGAEWELIEDPISPLYFYISHALKLAERKLIVRKGRV